MIKHKLFITTLIILLLAIMVVGIVLLLPQKVEVDLLEVNEIIEKAKVAIINDTNNYYSSKKYDYIVMDSTGKYLYSGIAIEQGDYKGTILKATSANYLMRDIVMGEEEYKVIIDTKQIIRYNQVAQSFTIAITIVISLVMALLLTWYIYIHVKIYKPFVKLDKFAEEVARGNLDQPLNMDKANSFGSFQEAFDIMRWNLRQSRDNERRAEEDKKNIIADLSHDLKLPISSIIAMAECIALKGDSDKASKIINQAEQINRIVTDIYNSTLNDIGALTVTACLHTSSHLIATIKDSDYRNVATIGEIPEVKLTYDAVRFKQILDNIIGNSYKYADTPIDVSSILEEDFLLITMRDYGEGVSQEHLAKLTDRFYRGNNVAEISGEGLGLYLAKTLMEKQGGTMQLKCDRGLHVTLGIPRAK